MNCQEAQKFIHAYLDGEFDEREWGTLAGHIDGCETCRRLVRFEERFRQVLRRGMSGPAAPPALRQRVLRVLDEMDAGESWSRRWLWRLIPAAAAASLLVAVLVSKNKELSPLSSMAEQSIEWHRRQMPMDVTASVPDVVRRFFSDKVPFAVRPPTFAMPQAQLVGARLANLREHQAVYLTYQVGDRRVSVFILDPSALPAVGPARRVGKREIYFQGVRGYNVAMFTAGGTGYAVTSDLDRDRLVQLIAHAE